MQSTAGDERIHVLAGPCQLLLSDKYGSEATWAFNLLKNLTRYCPVRVEAIVGHSDVTVIPEHVRIWSVSSRRSFSLSRQVRLRVATVQLGSKLLRTERIDIVHHMFPFGYRMGLNPLAILSRTAERPFVLGPIQLPQQFTSMGDAALVRSVSIDQASILLPWERLVTSSMASVLSALHKKTLDRSDALVFDSDRSRRIYETTYPGIFDSKIVKIIPMGVETDLFAFRAPPLDEKLTILTVGPLIERKGIRYLIEAMKVVKKAVSNCELVIAGEGPQRQELELLARRLGVEHETKFLGHADRRDLPAIYAGCQIYVQPSLSETIPSSIREAMSVGRPIIASAVGAVSELVVDGLNGVLVPSMDSAALAEHIVRVGTSDRLAQAMGQQSRSITERALDYRILAKEWFRLYQQLLQHGSSSADSSPLLQR